MHSLRLMAFAVVATTTTLPLACAYGGQSGSTSDVAMQVFTADNAPRCDFKEVGRVQRDTPAWATTADRAAASQDYREMIKKMGGDAVIRVDMPKEYIVIKFTDPDCRE